MSILLATRQGLYLENGSLTPLVEGADFLALARSRSDPDIVYAATRDGRVYRSKDGARSFTAVAIVSIKTADGVASGLTAEDFEGSW